MRVSRVLAAIALGAARRAEFATVGRDVVYYARALRAPTPAIDGATLRTRFDAAGAAISGSSPIYVDSEPGDE